MTPTTRSSGRGSKAAYTGKQKRMAEHIEEGYKKRGVSAKTAEARAWATVNTIDGGGKKTNKLPFRKGGRKGGPRVSR